MAFESFFKHRTTPCFVILQTYFDDINFIVPPIWPYILERKFNVLPFSVLFVFVFTREENIIDWFDYALKAGIPTALNKTMFRYVFDTHFAPFMFLESLTLFAPGKIYLRILANRGRKITEDANGKTHFVYSKNCAYFWIYFVREFQVNASLTARLVIEDTRPFVQEILSEWGASFFQFSKC